MVFFFIHFQNGTRGNMPGGRITTIFPIRKSIYYLCVVINYATFMLNNDKQHINKPGKVVSESQGLSREEEEKVMNTERESFSIGHENIL